MAKGFTLTGEKSVLAKLLGRDSMKKTASSSTKTLEETREQLSLEAKAIADKTPFDLRGYKNLESGPVKHQPKYSTSNKDQVTAAAGKKLSVFISDKVGRGGFTMDEVDFKKLESRPSHTDANYDMINKAVVAFKINFTTARDPKSCFAAVNYENDGKVDTFTVQSYLVDCENTDKKIQATRQEIEAHLSAAPSKVVANRKLVYFDVSNEQNQAFKELNVKSVAKAKARLEAAGFEVQSKVLGGENNITGPVFELILPTSRYTEAKNVLAADWTEVDTSVKADEKFEDSKGNTPDAKTDDPKNWQDRSLEKNAPAYMKPTDASQPKVNEPTKDTPATTWDTRSLEKNESTPLGKFTPPDHNKVKQDEKDEAKTNTPMTSDPATWPDRSLEKSEAPKANTLLKYERKAQMDPALLQQVETSPESVLTPPPAAPNEIPVGGSEQIVAPPMDGVAPMGIMPGEPTVVDKIIDMLMSTQLSHEEVNKIEEVIEQKEQEQVGPEAHEVEEKEEATERKEEHKEEKAEEPKEEKSEEPKEEKSEEKEPEMKKEEKMAQKVASKVQASTKKLANFQCACGSYLATPVCDCASPKMTSLGQVTDANTGNPAQPNPKFPGNSSKDSMDGLDSGKTMADGAKPKVVPSNEVKSQANPSGKPMSGKNPAVPNAEQISTKQEPMGGMTHGKGSDEGKAFEPPHGKGKGAWDGMNEANMIDMNALHKDKSPMDGMDHGKTDGGGESVTPSKEVPALKANLTPGNKKMSNVFRVSAAKKIEAMKAEVINQWDRGTLTTDQAAIKIAALDKSAQLGQEEVKPTPEQTKYFQTEEMGKDFKAYENKNWWNRSREKNPESHQKPTNIAQPTENEPTKDTPATTWDTRSLEKNPDTSVKHLDIAKTGGEMKPKQDEAFEKAHGNEPDAKDNDPTEWQNRSLEKRTSRPSDEKLMWTE